MLEKQQMSESSMYSSKDIARLSISPHRAELFLERFANLDSTNERRTDAFLKLFGDLLCVPDGRALVGFPIDTQLKLQTIWREPSLLMKEAQLMLLAGHEQRVEVELARWENRVVDLTQVGEKREERISPLLWVLLYALKHAALLRYCANPACKEPYFVARRGSQIYCSSPCAQPAQREAKLKWWNEYGVTRRRKSAAGKKRGKNA